MSKAANNVLVILSAIGLCMVWLIAGVFLLPFAIIGWVCTTVQRGLRAVQTWGQEA